MIIWTQNSPLLFQLINRDGHYIVYTCDDISWKLTRQPCETWRPGSDGKCQLVISLECIFWNNFLTFISIFGIWISFPFLTKIKHSVISHLVSVEENIYCRIDLSVDPHQHRRYLHCLIQSYPDSPHRNEPCYLAWVEEDIHCRAYHLILISIIVISFFNTIIIIDIFIIQKVIITIIKMSRVMPPCMSRGGCSLQS